QQALEDALPRLVVDDEVLDGVALGRGVLGVAAHVEVETGAVLEEDIAAPAPGDHPSEQVPGDLVRAEPPLAAEGAGDPVLVLEPEDAPVHASNGSVRGVQRTRMVRLATVSTTFHARVIAARLGAEGIVTDLRGNVDGIYPVGDVHVFVSEEDLPEAQELLLADEVEAAFDEDGDGDVGTPRELWVFLVAVVVVAAVLFARSI